MKAQKDNTGNKSFRGSTGVSSVLVLLGCMISAVAVAVPGADGVSVGPVKVNYDSDHQALLHRPELSVVPALHQAATANAAVHAESDPDLGLKAAKLSPDSDAYIVSAAVDPAEYALPDQRAAGNAVNRTGVESSGSKEDRPLPYALVLALIALVGLVPVSRRRNF